MRRSPSFAIALLALGVALARTSGAQSPLTPYQSLGRDVLRELIETNTTYSAGSTTKAAEQLAARFRAAGFPAADVQIVGPDTGVVHSNLGSPRDRGLSWPRVVDRPPPREGAPREKFAPTCC